MSHPQHKRKSCVRENIWYHIYIDGVTFSSRNWQIILFFDIDFVTTVQKSSFQSLQNSSYISYTLPLKRRNLVIFDQLKAAGPVDNFLSSKQFHKTRFSNAWLQQLDRDSKQILKKLIGQQSEDVFYIIQVGR